MLNSTRMFIQFYGLDCFRLTNGDFQILVNPPETTSGISRPRGQADVLLNQTQIEKSDDKIKSLGKRIIDQPGEYDIAGTNIVGIPIKQEKNWKTIYWIEIGGVKVLCIGNINQWSGKEDGIDDLGNTDVLLVPVGGHDVLNAQQAASIVRELEAKIIIPSHFTMPGIKTDLETPDKFFKELGQTPESTDKYKITAKEIPTEGVKIVHLQPTS